MLIAEAITITNYEETTSMRGGFFVPFFRGSCNGLPLGPGVVSKAKQRSHQASQVRAARGVREATGGCCRWLVLDPVDRAIERPSDRVIELAHALLLAGVRAAGPAPQRVRAWRFVGVAGNRSRVVLLLLDQS